MRTPLGRRRTSAIHSSKHDCRGRIIGDSIRPTKESSCDREYLLRSPSPSSLPSLPSTRRSRQILCRRPSRRRGLAVEIRDLTRLPDTRVDARRRSGCEPCGLGARAVRPRSAGRPPVRQRLARVSLPARQGQQARGVRQRRQGVPVCHLQQAGKRAHRLRLPSRVREERVVLHRAWRARDGQSGEAEFHPAGYTEKM